MTPRKLVTVLALAVLAWALWLGALVGVARWMAAQAETAPVQLERSCVCDEWRTVGP